MRVSRGHSQPIRLGSIAAPLKSLITESDLVPFPADKAGLHCGAVETAEWGQRFIPFPADKAGLHCGWMWRYTPIGSRTPFPADKAGLHCGRSGKLGGMAISPAIPSR